METEPPQYAGHYRLERCLGSGGMGVVHLAVNAVGRQLAVKVVHAQHAAEDEFRARFRQEVAAARRVSGAFTASVVDADPEAARPWMATVFIDGPTLSERVKRNGPLDARELLRLGSGLAEALRDIHRAGVVHRDLKPSNVLLAPDGPKVIDFGISRPADADGELRTETGKLIGTPPFMAPEQFQRPREVGPAADVFAMGAVLVHAATGRGPFDSDSPYVVAYQVVHDEPDMSAVPRALVPVLRRCLEKEPGLRPTAGQLLAAFAALASGGVADAAGSRPESAGAETGPDSAGGTGSAGGESAGTAGRTMVLGVRGRGGGETDRNGTGSGAGRGAGDGSGGSGAEGRRTRRRPRAVTALATLAVLAVTVTGVVTLASAREGGERPRTPAQTAAHAGRPWASTLGAAGAENRMPLCAAADRALYCTAAGVRAARLDAAGGKTVWSVRGEAAEPGPAPVLSGGLVHLVEPDARRLTALDPADGSEVWHADVSAYPSVVHAGGTVLLAGADGAVRALDGRTGKERWSTWLPVGGAQWVAGPDGTAYAAVLTPDGRATRVYAVAVADGAVAWDVRLTGDLGPVQATGSAVLLLSRDAEQYTDAVVRLDTGERRARRVELGVPVDQAQAVLADGTAYVVGAGGSLVAVAVDREPAAGTETETGAVRWRLDTGVSRASRPLVVGGTVYLTAADGRLLAVDAGRGRLVGATRARMDDGRYTFSALLPAPLAGRGAVYATAPDGSVFAQRTDDPGRW
nr:serine/threonine-protein kinase [Streptomyces sp. ODS05-4]